MAPPASARGRRRDWLGTPRLWTRIVIGSARHLVVLLGIATVLAACSSVSGRAPVSDRSTDGHRGQSVVDIARKHVGAPYRWGGTSPSGFDCSGFVRYVYAQVGVSLPHNAAKQYGLGTPVSRDSLEPGDLVFFDRLRHNGIYVGDGRFIHARQTGKRVGIASLDDEWYAAHWAGARRLEPPPQSVDRED
ncbi:MAG: hypothetical protein DMD96_27525 [Candidatus Rokuibacteriota bacterium]|nr:MAG: hypothetical protein DMD96_27525 [Candidatus Rokubacteria bacterium]